MERTQIYLDSKNKEKLRQLAKETGKAMAELIREAVELYVARNQDLAVDKLQSTAGLWSGRDDMDDTIGYINDLRSQWKVKRDNSYNTSEKGD